MAGDVHPAVNHWRASLVATLSNSLQSLQFPLMIFPVVFALLTSMNQSNFLQWFAHPKERGHTKLYQSTVLSEFAYQ